MTLDDVIRLAREARLPNSDLYHGNLETFAKLVAKHEREACANVCENIYTGEEACGDWPTPEMCAEAIRARGEQA
jgi:hypothetical protein